MATTTEEIKPINERTEELDLGYVCFYAGKRIALYAKSQYDAVLRAREHFKPRKSQQHMVSAVLVENRDGTPHVQSTGQFG